MRFQDKVVVITGASGGIGQRLVKAFWANGAKIYAAYNLHKLELPESCIQIQANLRDNMEAKKLVSQLPRIDILIHATGLVENASVDKMNIGAWNRVIETNLTAIFNVTNYSIDKMNESGHIVILGSIVGSIGGIGCINYAASKSALVGFVKALSNELARRKVYVNLLELGYYEIGMGTNFTPELKEKISKSIPLGRFGDPLDIIKAVFFLVETEYMTGNVLKVAGGL